jgi:uncharacterized protein YeaO (DUF488 family)
MIKIKRVYEEPSDDDGIRILIDKLWPRGINKEKAGIDFWFKDIAPSNELRKTYHAGSVDFSEFKKRYLRELSEYKHIHNAASVSGQDNPLSQISGFVNAGKNLTLLYGLKDEINNNAAVLKEFILKSL